MSRLSFLYFSFLSASGEGGAHFKSVAAEIKTWWRVPECMFARKKEEQRGGRGLNLYLGVFFPCQWGAWEEAQECWQGSLTCMIRTHSRYTQKQPAHLLHYLWNGAIISCFTPCQEKSSVFACTQDKRACMFVFIGELRKEKSRQTKKPSPMKKEQSRERRVVDITHGCRPDDSRQKSMKDWKERSVSFVVVSIFYMLWMLVKKLYQILNW